MTMLRILIPLAAVLLAGCALNPAENHAAGGRPAVPPWGLDLSIIDRGVAPADDFFAYANGLWLKSAQIPEDRSYAGVNLEINLRNEARLKAILAELVSRPDGALTAEARKLRDLFAAYTDGAAIEARGMAPARADLALLAGLATHRQVAEAMGDPALQLDGPFGSYIDADDKDPEAYALRLYQSGLGLPDRDYYLRDDAELRRTRTAYTKYLATMLGFAGIADAEPRAAAVLALETGIAQAHWPAADRRDADLTYNRMTLSELETLAPAFPWRAALQRAGVPANGPKGERAVIVSEKSAFPKLAALFAATPVAVWRDYLVTRYLHTHAALLPRQVDEADFAFYGTVLNGNPKQLDRVTRGVRLVDRTMGEALGKLYVERHFPPAAKAKADALVQNLLKAYAADMRTLDWMGPQTRAKALDKLQRMMLKIGHPDTWRDYSALQIRRDDLIGNVQRAAQFEWKREVDRIDLPVVRTEWHMSPPTNNAYYNPALNEIVFPAGILQPPFFDPDADDAVNYAGIGSTIGHEISHGFDDQGSKYDGSGMLRDWWTPEDRRNFDARTRALADQFDAFEPLPGVRINGRLTLGENIADLAGLVIARKAYQLALGGKPAPVLDGYTGEQRFYLAYAQSWRHKDREGRLRSQLLSDPHAPSPYRVNACIRNDDGWYAAFAVPPGSRYYLAPPERVRLW
jgi:putative endopeptidase